MPILLSAENLVPFSILWEDEALIAIQKPAGIMVHKSGITEDKIFIIQLLRDQIGQYIYPVHRLDRGTSGVLLLSKESEWVKPLSLQFEEKSVQKKYLAVVRGHLAMEGLIDYALSDAETGKENQEAQTFYKTLLQSEMPYKIGNKYNSARFSLVEANPHTGRRHQIRKHFAHVFHPIIGDKRHGDCKHNKFFTENFEMERMLLHGAELHFTHPKTAERLHIEAPLTADFEKGMKLCGF